MVALITGASSGIGRDIARELSKRGYDLILVARRETRLLEVKASVSTKAEVFTADLTQESECERLCGHLADTDIDIVVNNAGFGLYGDFSETDLQREIDLIHLNIRAVHILTKFFVQKFMERDKGILLNVASSASFMPGPYMAAYYASKAYVLRLSQAVNEELSQRKSRAYISVLCPGPVDTEFNSVADVKFRLNGLSSAKVAKYTVQKMLAGRKIIVPGTAMKLTRFFAKVLPDCILVKFARHFQKKKMRG